MRHVSRTIARYVVLGVVLASLASFVSMAYDEAPMLAELVRRGLLPTVDERLPDDRERLRRPLPGHNGHQSP